MRSTPSKHPRPFREVPRDKKEALIPNIIRMYVYMYIYIYMIIPLIYYYDDDDYYYYCYYDSYYYLFMARGGRGRSGERARFTPIDIIIMIIIVSIISISIIMIDIIISITVTCRLRRSKRSGRCPTPESGIFSRRPECPRRGNVSGIAPINI